ncbi:MULTISPECIES: DsbA family oxidoreductase [Alteromonas]|jgi:predicted DsbA family dithiol-disulfide isomerase|uniref:DsbA family oxidoreductase n=1 Tax=Alteromonas TaxID=226 RepID=UPI001EF33980|nr:MULTISPECIES: DsbA family oxidoreductase [Alteromonas]MCG7638184.1 DsbA family oxidoreductase [Alteromonas sp. CNT1-28]MCG7814581.1 DsbA family oxidoreductase [Alteromonas sp. MCA-1]MDW5286015.1 DsbA family oxidoreductase [Alteromonas macleodii]MEC8296078.1 DsbA family oxidoreductase [Pseudomonadota bacterium]
MAANEQGVQSASGMQSVTVNMVSDVVCPWCIVGYQRLQEAIKTLDNIEVDIKFHPFELNPNMPEDGQNLREHIMEKYGISEQQSVENRARLVQAGKELGFAFNFTDDSRMQNTFKAHQLIHFAAQNGLEEEMKLSLFNAYFTDGKDVNDLGVLVELAESVGLDKTEAEAVIKSEKYAQAVREEETIWMQRGIQSVPTFVIGNQGVAGAQEPATLAAFIAQAASQQ